MRIRPALLAITVALSLGNAALAQVYKSQDAEGNTVYSDMPSPGAEKMDLPEPNVSESVEVPERPPEAPASRPGAPVIQDDSAEEEDGPRILDEDDNMWSLNKSDLSRSVRIETSSMPSYLDRLSEQELEDLVAYLYGLIRSEG